MQMFLKKSALLLYKKKEIHNCFQLFNLMCKLYRGPRKVDGPVMGCCQQVSLHAPAFIIVLLSYSRRMG